MPASPDISPETSKQLSAAFEGAFAALTSGVSLSRLGVISPEKIEALYALGQRSYVQKDYKKAEEVFAFAHRLDSLHPRIVKGLAASLKMQGKFKKR